MLVSVRCIRHTAGTLAGSRSPLPLAATFRFRGALEMILAISWLLLQFRLASWDLTALNLQMARVLLSAIVKSSGRLLIHRTTAGYQLRRVQESFSGGLDCATATARAFCIDRVTRHRMHGAD